MIYALQDTKHCFLITQGRKTNQYNFHSKRKLTARCPEKDCCLFLLVTAFNQLNFVYLLYILAQVQFPKVHWNSLSDLILLSTFNSPGVLSASNRNVYQRIFLEITTAGTWVGQPCHIHVLNVWISCEPQSPRTPKAYLGLCRDSRTFTPPNYILASNQVATIWALQHCRGKMFGSYFFTSLIQLKVSYNKTPFY